VSRIEYLASCNWRLETVDLKELRKRIDVLDEEILRLLNQRTETVLEIGRLKAEANADYYAPHREQAIINRLSAINRGPLPNTALRIVYKEIMSACRSLEKRLSVAYLGPEASNTHIATIKQFGSSVVYRPVRSQGEVFREVETGRADYGIVAIENSTEGAVNATLDAFVKSHLEICSEILLPISHYLLSNSPLGEIKEVHSYPQVLAQCRGWIERNLSHAEVVAAASSAEAAILAAKEKDVAAIGTRLAADVYGLDILAEEIQDIPKNMTRFFVIGHHYSERTGNDKTSILFSVKHQPGALAGALTLLARHGLNLTNIQLRPSGMKAWEYIFFVDLEGHIDDEPVKQALGELEKESLLVKMLGSYPKAEGDV
jgi:chorismate mutase/prephenate dehydratase